MIGRGPGGFERRKPDGFAGVTAFCQRRHRRPDALVPLMNQRMDAVSDVQTAQPVRTTRPSHDH